MIHTRHIAARMTQRGIRRDVVTLAMQFGESDPNGRVVLGRKALRYLMDELKQLLRTAQKAAECGGVVVVAEGDVLLTAYRLERTKKSPAEAAVTPEQETE